MEFLWYNQGIEQTNTNKEITMAEPTQKHPAIEALLTRMTGKDRPATIRSNTCVRCGGPADKFHDELSRREYRISGFCQICKDKTFGA